LACRIRQGPLYLNNFSKMRINLAVNTLSQVVAVEMEENKNEDATSTREYI